MGCGVGIGMGVAVCKFVKRCNMVSSFWLRLSSLTCISEKAHSRAKMQSSLMAEGATSSRKLVSERSEGESTVADFMEHVESESDDGLWYVAIVNWCYRD